MPTRDFALLAGICLVWAGNNIVSKIIIAHFGAPPLFYATARFALVTLLTLPWLLQRFAEVAQVAIRNRGNLLLTKRS